MWNDNASGELIPLSGPSREIGHYGGHRSVAFVSLYAIEFSTDPGCEWAVRMINASVHYYLIGGIWHVRQSWTKYLSFKGADKYLDEILAKELSGL